MQPPLKKGPTMKIYKLIAVLLIVLTVLSLVACGKDPVDTSGNKPAVTDPDEGEEEGRDAVKDTVPADLNFANRNDNTVTFFVRNNDPIFTTEICVEKLTNDVLFDAIYYRNIDVEERLGVKIVQIAQPGSELDTGWQTWNQTLATSVLTNTHDYDAAAIHTYCGSVLALQNVFADLHTLQDAENGGYLNLSKPWWNQSSVDELTVFGSLYFVCGDMMITETARAYAVFFNKDLFAEKFPEENYADLYQMVRDGTWTADKFVNYLSQVWDDVNANGVKDDGDTVGYLYGTSPTINTWVYALGMDITEKNQYGEPTLSYIYDPDIVKAFELVQKVYNPEADGVLGGQRFASTGFDKGNQLFSINYLESGETMRSTSVNYGVLPMPKFNEEQDDYRTNFVGHVSALALCSDITAERRAIVTSTCELMAAESYKQVIPAYYNKVLKGIYSKDMPDAEMYDIIVESVVIDFGSCLFKQSGTSLKSYVELFNNAKKPNYDIAQTISGYTIAWELALATMLEGFENIQ